MQRIDCDNCGKQILKANIVEGAVSVKCERCNHTQIIKAGRAAVPAVYDDLKDQMFIANVRLR